MAHERILIVDPDDQQRLELACLLQAAGYATLEAASSQAALVLAKHEQPAAIFLEVVLPGADGWALARQLKTDPITCAIPLVLMSLLRPEAGAGPPCDIAAYVTKPFSPEQVQAAAGRALRAWRWRTPPRILIADDEADTIDILSTIFRHEGCVTLEARDGAEALDLSAREHPDVVILDVAMPNVDGWETLKALKRDAALRDIPVIMLTGRALAPQDAQAALALGAARYVTKPFGTDALIQEIAAVLHAS